MRAPSLPTKWGVTLPRGKVDRRSTDASKRKNINTQTALCSAQISPMASENRTEAAQAVLVPKEEPNNQEVPDLLVESAFAAEGLAACPLDGENGTGPSPSPYSEPQIEMSEQQHVLQFPILTSPWTAEESKLLDDGIVKRA